MARKHNTKHRRAQSRYPERLQARGLSSAAVRMESLETLRKRQGVRHPEPDIDLYNYRDTDLTDF